MIVHRTASPVFTTVGFVKATVKLGVPSKAITWFHTGVVLDGWATTYFLTVPEVVPEVKYTSNINWPVVVLFIVNKGSAVVPV